MTPQLPNPRSPFSQYMACQKEGAPKYRYPSHLISFHSSPSRSRLSSHALPIVQPPLPNSYPLHLATPITKTPIYASSSSYPSLKPIIHSPTQQARTGDLYLLRTTLCCNLTRAPIKSHLPACVAQFASPHSNPAPFNPVQLSSAQLMAK
jgi:hypothetical protein